MNQEVCQKSSANYATLVPRRRPINMKARASCSRTGVVNYSGGAVRAYKFVALRARASSATNLSGGAAVAPCSMLCWSVIDEDVYALATSTAAATAAATAVAYGDNNNYTGRRRPCKVLLDCLLICSVVEAHSRTHARSDH